MDSPSAIICVSPGKCLRQAVLSRSLRRDARHLSGVREAISMERFQLRTEGRYRPHRYAVARSRHLIRE